MRDIFGYIRISKGELKVKEYEMYKAVYCSLCRITGKKYGKLSRFTLSYDFTFLGLLNMSLQSGFNGTERKCCRCNPFKKCNYCKDEDALLMPAAASVILLYHKLNDDIKDEKFFKKAVALFLKICFNRGYKKAKKEYPEIETAVADYVTAQSLLEKKENVTPDEAANPTSEMLGFIFSLCSEDENQKRVLVQLGKLLGQYIYITDAVADLEKDIKYNRFNVYKNGDIAETKLRAKRHIYLIINNAEKTFELLDIKKFKDILGNIIYVGMEDTAEKEFLNG